MAVRIRWIQKEIIIVKARLEWDHMEGDNREADQRKTLEKAGSYSVEQDPENLRLFAKQCQFLWDSKD